MKVKLGLTFLALLIISALALYVFAQVPPDKQQEEIRKALLLQKSQSQNQPERLQEERQQTVRKTMLIDKQVITLLHREDGKVDYIQVIPPSSAILGRGTLRIKLMDGSVQEIPLFSVKEVTIEQGGNIR